MLAVIISEVVTLLFLAGLTNSFMDSIESVAHFNKSIFYKLNPSFWCKETASQTAKFLKGTKFRIDAWHIAKFVLVFEIVTAVCIPFTLVFEVWAFAGEALGLVWIAGFNTGWEWFGGLFQRKKSVSE